MLCFQGMKTLGLYYRVSTPPQDTTDKDSIPSQKAAGRAFAALNDVPSKEYQDVYSGGKENRKGFDLLSEDISNGKVDAVWVRDTDRLARDVWIGSGLLKLLVENKGTLFIGNQEIDPSDYQQVLTPNIQFAIAQYERGAIRARTLRGRKANIAKGNRVSHSIYGYNSAYDGNGKRNCVVNEVEAKVVRHIFMLYRQGKSFRLIAKLLNDEGIKTKKNGRTIKNRYTKEMEIVSCRSREQTSISNIIRRPEYVGYVSGWEHKNLIKATFCTSNPYLEV